MTKPNLGHFLSAEERAAIRAPIESARTLPRRAFIDPDFYAFECRSVLDNTWLAVDFDDQLQTPGDLLPTVIRGEPVLLVCDSNRRVRAFANVCPFDSSELVITPTRGAEKIVTPYHGWEYSLDGQLLATPYWDGTPNPVDAKFPSAVDLIEFPCEVWMHTVFVYLGDQPIPFANQFAAVLKHFDAVDLQRLRPGIDGDGRAFVHRHPIGANWKTVYENYSPNVYHESFVHAMYRRSPHSPRVDADGNKTYSEINDPSGFLGLCYDNAIGGSFYGESRLPPVLNKDGTPNRVNTIANVFPNWVTTVLGNAARIAIFLPDGPESGAQLVLTLFDEEGATNPQLLGERQQSVKAGILARDEDNRICESIQRARRSSAYNAQFYSPFWDAMHYTLSNLILDRLESVEDQES